GVAGGILGRGLERPVLLRDERLDLALPIDDEPEGDGLDATGREPVPDLLPEERRHRVAAEPIHDAASLLRVHEILVDLARVLEGLLDRRRRDLVEGHALHLRLRDVDDVRQVPGDRLALAVEVRREPHARRRLGLPAEEAGLRPKTRLARPAHTPPRAGAPRAAAPRPPPRRRAPRARAAPLLPRPKETPAPSSPPRRPPFFLHPPRPFLGSPGGGPGGPD